MSKELETLTVKELKVRLVELGMPEEDADKFRTKAPMISVINTMLAKDVVVEVKSDEKEVKKVASIQERPSPVEEKEVNKSWKTKAERMKQRLFEQEFVSMVTQLESGEKIGEVEWVDAKTKETISDEGWYNLPIEAKMRTYQRHISGAVLVPQLNGFKYMIPKGRYTKVPMQIFEVVNAANMEALKAIQHKNLDRIDPKTGRPMKESL
jgi:hypothetical protein